MSLSSIRNPLESIVRWSSAVKIGSTAVGLFWFLQAVKDELLPEEWEDRLRLVNLLPHFRWYVWVILLLGVWLVGVLEGVIRWHKHEIAPILGRPNTLHRETFVVAGKIRDFITKFIADNGEMPRLYPTADDKERIRMNTAISDWSIRFSQQFRIALHQEVKDTLHKIQAEGIALDFARTGVLNLPTIYPHNLMDLAGQLMAGGLALTLKGDAQNTGSMPSSHVS
jgi:hypothetical protein